VCAAAERTIFFAGIPVTRDPFPFKLVFVSVLAITVGSGLAVLIAYLWIDPTHNQQAIFDALDVAMESWSWGNLRPGGRQGSCPIRDNMNMKAPRTRRGEMLTVHPHCLVFFVDETGHEEGRNFEMM
jgi:hypothetical protein